MPDYITLVSRNRIADALTSTAGAALAREVLPSYLMKRRWFAAKDQSIKSVRFKYLAVLPGERELLLTEVESNSDGELNRWLLPLGVVWDEEPAVALPAQLALARVRRVRRVGLLTDAFSLAAFARQMLAAFCARTRIETPEGTIVFDPVEESKDALCRPRERERAVALRRAVEQLADRR